MRNATVIPNGRDNTYDPTEVSRRTAEEHYENSFSEEQKDGLESQFSGGSSDSPLPSVTADDNDMVLTVVNGQWDKAEASGGGTALVVGHDADYQHFDKTWQEIYDALADGRGAVYRESSAIEYSRYAYELPIISANEGLDNYYTVTLLNTNESQVVAAVGSCSSSNAYPSYPFE